MTLSFSLSLSRRCIPAVKLLSYTFRKYAERQSVTLLVSVRAERARQTDRERLSDGNMFPFRMKERLTKFNYRRRHRRRGIRLLNTTLVTQNIRNEMINYDDYTVNSNTTLMFFEPAPSPNVSHNDAIK